METAEVTTTNSENTTNKSEANSNDDNVNKTDETVCDNTEITVEPETDLLNKTSQQSNERQELTWESVAAEIQAHEESSSSQYEIVQPDTQTEKVNVLTSDGDNTIQTTTITTIEDTITTTTTSSTSEIPIVTQSDTVENSIAQSTDDDHMDNIEEIEMLIKSGEKNLETKEDSNNATNNVIVNNEEKSMDKEQETEKTVEETSENTKDETVHQVPTETIEITELQPDEIGQMDDVTGIEYTVIEAEESTEIITETGSTTEEIVLLPIDDDTDPNRSEENSQDIIEGVFIIKNDGDVTIPTTTTTTTDTSQTTTETVTTSKTTTATATPAEESVDDPEEKPKQTKPKKPRGRRPIADIPLHVLGRDISKPTEGVSNGGRTMPKPRLGVKVPYKNLTSQIVSKEEIQKEIMDRFKQRQEQSVASGDILFARKLTQRLAKRLGPVTTTTSTTTTATETTSTTTMAVATTSTAAVTTTTTTTTTTSTPSHVETSQAEENKEKNTATKKGEPETINRNMNNSDLIAILEGETDEPQTTEKQVESKSYTDKQQFYKDIEKEIALQQLSELPLTKNRIFKSRGQHQQYEANKTGTPPTTNKSSNTSVPNKINETPTTSNSTNTTKKTQETPTKTDKKNSDIEPQLKAEQVVKTYTRKRRSFELDTILPTKKSVVVKEETSTTNSQSSSDVYVTKSSRIIKKKVIWDPDETPTKSPTVAATTTTTTSTRSASSSSPRQQTQQHQDSDKSPEKKASVSPVKKTSISPPKKPKRLTEVDRLLMDEGAVNMLYDVKQNDDKSKNKNKKVISLDKAHRELMSKTNVIKNDLQQNTIKESGVSLRKKDTPASPKKDTPNIVTRKKSKDFNKNSGGSPPASPNYQLAEASRIIRRHSSSSFSSNDGQVDGDNVENIKNKKQRTTVANNEPPKKKFKKPTEVSNKTNINNNNNNNNNSNNIKIEKDTTKYKTFTVTKMNTFISIELNYTETKYYLTEEVLKELTVCLKELSNDNDCNVVSITSSGGDSFCHGIDYRCLVAEDVDVRKKKAIELCNLIKDFIRCLLHFPKVLVAGIQGDCVGLGVTMLPLFDMVIASDTSTFSTPYGCLGCGPEAGFLLGIPYLNNHGLASELLYTSQTVKAEDAVRSGLVTRLCWPEKYHNELKSILVEIASQSRQSIEATKAQFRRQLFESTESLLNSSMDNLIEQWISAECQKNFSKYKIELNNQ